MHKCELRAVARSLAYGLYECSPFISQLTSKEQAYGYSSSAPTKSIIDSMHRNQVSEFWHCLNRKSYVEGPHVDERMISNDDVNIAIANTLAWLKWYNRDGHKQSDETPEEDRIPMPEWGKEYI